MAKLNPFPTKPDSILGNIQKLQNANNSANNGIKIKSIFHKEEKKDGDS